MEETKLDRTFLGTEAWFWLLVKTLERITRTAAEEKRDAFCSIFVNATTTDGSQGPIKDICIRVMDDLTPDHMWALRLAARHDAAPTVDDTSVWPDFTSLTEFRVGLAPLTDVEVDAVLHDLSTMGLLTQQRQGFFELQGVPARERYRLTPLGVRFAWFITMPDARSPSDYHAP